MPGWRSVLVCSKIVGWYVILAILFVLAYMRADQLGWQIGSAAEKAVHLSGFAECLYFSVVTATTLGYGDFYPVDGLPGFLVCSQVMMFWFVFTVGFVMVERVTRSP